MFTVAEFDGFQRRSVVRVGDARLMPTVQKMLAGDRPRCAFERQLEQSSQ